MMKVAVGSKKIEISQPDFLIFQRKKIFFFEDVTIKCCHHQYSGSSHGVNLSQAMSPIYCNTIVAIV